MAENANFINFEAKTSSTGAIRGSLPRLGKAWAGLRTGHLLGGAVEERSCWPAGKGPEDPEPYLSRLRVTSVRLGRRSWAVQVAFGPAVRAAAALWSVRQECMELRRAAVAWYLSPFNAFAFLLLVCLVHGIPPYRRFERCAFACARAQKCCVCISSVLSDDVPSKGILKIDTADMR